jgi:cell division transport system permease protein
MSLSYTLRESFSGFTRTKLSSILSVLTIAIALLLLGLFTVITIHANRFLDELRNRVEVEAFLEEPIALIDVDSLGRVIANLEGVERVEYVSKERAAEMFRREFGEDILNVLDYNPLPPSFKVFLKDGYKTPARAGAFEQKLRACDGIEDVIYRKATLELIDQRARTLHNITLGLGILVGLSAIILVSNTIRLAIYAKRQLIRTMELVGATRLFIRVPFLLEGILQGLLGGLIAAGFLYILLVYGLRYISSELATYIAMPAAFYLLVVMAGLLLGLVGGLIAVTRFIRRD